MKKFTKDDFNSNIVKLVLGTGFSQVLPIALMPILTRLYSPEDFGVFAVYLAVSGILGVIATGRYELAIVLPDNNQDSSNIFWLCTGISAILSACILIFIFVYFANINEILGFNSTSKILFLIPASVFLAGFLQALNYYHIRTKMFGKLSKSKVVLGSGSASTQLISGALSSPSGFGLSVGYLFGQLLTVVYLLQNVRKFRQLLRIEFRSILFQAKKYKNFPLLSSPGALLDTSAVQLPIFLINGAYSTAVAGQFSLAMRIINMPLALISGAISQVLLQKIASSDNVSPEIVKPLILKLAMKLAILISPLFITCYFYGEELFTFIFGPEWKMAGSFSAPIAMVISFRFIVNPLSSVLSLNRNIKFGAFWQFCYFLTTLICLVYASSFGIDTFLIIFLVNEIIMYSFYFLLILKGADSYKGENEDTI